MNKNLIHSNGRQFARKVVTPILCKDNALYFCGGGCIEMYHCIECQKRFGKPSMMWTAMLCAECEKKRKEKECAKETVSHGPLPFTPEKSIVGLEKSQIDATSKNSSSLQTEFKSGDKVECLPFGKFANGVESSDKKGYMVGRHYKIEAIFHTEYNLGEPVASIGDTYVWPLRALKHVVVGL
jgi:hypothetical protein